MIELLLNGKPVQFNIDTGAYITTISEEYSRNWMESLLRETSKSLYGPAKQAPANNAWTIHWHADISTIKHVSRDFRSSIVATRESVSVDKEHSKQYGGQGSVDNYKR